MTIKVPQSLIKESLKEGYTHFHWEVFRMMLTYNGRKGCPVTARLALFNTRVLKYQYAVICTVITTLNANTIMLIVFPNFFM